MDFKTSDKEGVKIVKIIGNLDTNTSSQAREVFQNLISDGATRVLLDCTDLDYLSSSGIRVLLTTSKQLHGKGSFGICNLNEHVREVLDVTGLSGLIFKIYDSEGQALNEL